MTPITQHSHASRPALRVPRVEVFNISKRFAALQAGADEKN